MNHPFYQLFDNFCNLYSKLLVTLLMNSTNGDLTCPHTKSDKLIFWTIFESSSLDFTFSFSELPVKSTSGGATLGTFPAWVLGIACNSLEISIFCLIELHLYLLIALLLWPVCLEINCLSTFLPYNLLAVVALKLLLLKLPSIPAASIIFSTVKANTFFPTGNLLYQ